MSASRLGLGTVQFGLPYGVSNAGGQVPAGEAAAIVAAAHAAGLRVLDTAAAYGEAEDVLAPLRPQAVGWRVVTKTARLAAGLDAVVARARRSAETLGAGCDLLVHSARDLAGRDGDALWRALQDLKAQGLFARIGVSAYVDDDPAELARRLSPDLVQVPLSLLDQRLLLDGSLDAIRAAGAEVHVRSIFLQGLLLLDPADFPAALAPAAGGVARVRAQARARGLTPLALAVAFALSQPHVDAAIVGVTSRAELAEIVAAAGGPAPDVDWTTLALDDDFVLTPSRWMEPR